MNLLSENIYYKVFIFLTTLVWLLISKSPAIAVSTFGDTCFECHTSLQKKILKGKAHDPVKKGNCIVCHNPHASRYKGLLNETREEICYSCHKNGKFNDFNKAIIHDPVKTGKCLTCHDPHTSTNSKLLVKKGGEICFSCHTRDYILSKKESHPLVKKGNCIGCHSPHSSNNEGLLIKKSGDLCSSCHKTGKSEFITAHAGYSVGKSDCSSCHNTHSSDKKSLLKASLHLPLAKKECTACHKTTNSKNPLALKYSGAELCYQCHKETKKDFEKTASHLIGNRENSCLNCHNPHASDSKNLLAGSVEKVCFKCHFDTKKRMKAKTIKTVHPKIENCSACHVAHGSDNILFLARTEEETCSNSECHKTQLIFSHPVGPEIIDPRTKKHMTCLTCHDPMGTGYNSNLKLDPNRELCEQCHNI